MILPRGCDGRKDEYGSGSVLAREGLKTGQGATDAVLQRTDWTSVLEEVPPRKLPELTFAETFDLPIFINCHNYAFIKEILQAIFK